MSNRPPITFAEKREGTLVQLALALLLMVPISLWWGLALSMLWGWFVVPLGAFSLSTVHAAGLHVVLSLLAPSFRSHEREFWEAMALSIILPGVSLLLGWLLTLFL